jgi:hypothetical protein
MKKNLRLLGAGALLRLMAGILAACAGDCSAKEQPAVQTVNTNNVRWGEITNGLQMGIVVEPAFGVVHCWLRNGETNEIAYNNWNLAFWENIGLEAREGTNWVRLARDPATLRPREGIGPSIGEIVRLQPGEVIADRRPNYPAYAGRRFGDWVTETNGVQHRRLSTPSPPVPASRKPTFFVDLLDFEWPTNVLHQQACEIRVCHSFAPCQMSGSFVPADGRYARGSGFFTVCSPVFILDGTAMQSLLDQLPDAKGR